MKELQLQTDTAAFFRVLCCCAQVNVKGLNNVRVVVKTFSFAELKKKLQAAQESGATMAM